MRILLIRHGRTEANERMLYYGRTDLPLSEGGRTDLHAMREKGGYPDITGLRVYTSGMLRTEETLEILFGEREHVAVPALREMDFGAFEMRSYEELKDDPDFCLWCEGDNESNVTPGGESGKQSQARAIAGFEELRRRGEDFLLVAHGGPIAAIMRHLFPEEGKSWFEWMTGNGKGFWIELNGEEKRWNAVPASGEEHG